VYFDDLVDLASSSFIYSYSKYVILLKIGAAMIKYKEKMAKWINVLKNNLYYKLYYFTFLIENR
jgi:hypothetical protein